MPINPVLAELLIKNPESSDILLEAFAVGVQYAREDVSMFVTPEAIIREFDVLRKSGKLGNVTTEDFNNLQEFTKEQFNFALDASDTTADTKVTRIINHNVEKVVREVALRIARLQGLTVKLPVEEMEECLASLDENTGAWSKITKEIFGDSRKTLTTMSNMFNN